MPAFTANAFGSGPVGSPFASTTKGHLRRPNAFRYRRWENYRPGGGRSAPAFGPSGSFFDYGHDYGSPFGATRGTTGAFTSPGNPGQSTGLGDMMIEQNPEAWFRYRMAGRGVDTSQDTALGRWSGELYQDLLRDYQTAQMQNPFLTWRKFLAGTRLNRGDIENRFKLLPAERRGVAPLGNAMGPARWQFA